MWLHGDRWVVDFTEPGCCAAAAGASLVFWLMRCSLCLQMRSVCGRRPSDTLLIAVTLQALFFFSLLNFSFSLSLNLEIPPLQPCFLSCTSLYHFPLARRPAAAPSPHCSLPAPSASLTRPAIAPLTTFILCATTTKECQLLANEQNAVITWFGDGDSRFILFQFNSLFSVSGVHLEEGMRLS